MSYSYPALWKVLAGAALCLSLEMMFRCIRRRRRRPLREVLFFPAPLSCTEPVLSPGLSCPCPLPHTDTALCRLLRLLLGAQRSLEVCVFTVSSQPLARAVLQLHHRGVRVRVISDSDYMASHGSQIGVLRQEGVVVRHNQSEGYMHHKFAILDKSVVITGSLNWTVQAVHTNKENVLISDDQAYVQAYLEEFERLWEEYDPATYDFFPEKDQK
ncbi:mitochondrial cardiolipin hydrolase [Spea bombifrons]|uniref:mitochondrial cardiolipin hydrolase n=1 Tax=Spea bombifrons TaxID=233779 RepID=UPI00234BABF4|nr:mitochondrial cardiolipin hydrolase [Spea bombifrons]